MRLEKKDGEFIDIKFWSFFKWVVLSYITFLVMAFLTGFGAGLVLAFIGGV